MSYGYGSYYDYQDPESYYTQKPFSIDLDSAIAQQQQQAALEQAKKQQAGPGGGLAKLGLGGGTGGGGAAIASTGGTMPGALGAVSGAGQSVGAVGAGSLGGGAAGLGASGALGAGTATGAVSGAGSSVAGIAAGSGATAGTAGAGMGVAGAALPLAAVVGTKLLMDKWGNEALASGARKLFGNPKKVYKTYTPQEMVQNINNESRRKPYWEDMAPGWSTRSDAEKQKLIEAASASKLLNLKTSMASPGDDIINFGRYNRPPDGTESRQQWYRNHKVNNVSDFEQFLNNQSSLTDKKESELRGFLATLKGAK